MASSEVQSGGFQEKLKDLDDGKRAENGQDAYKEYRENYWEMGDDFIGIMADSILETWEDYSNLSSSVNADYLENEDLSGVKEVFQEYMGIVYDEEGMNDDIVEKFVRYREDDTEGLEPLDSRMFDGLSFAFYYDVFHNEKQPEGRSLEDPQYQFAVEVGERVFGYLKQELDIELPKRLQTEDQFEMVQNAIDEVGDFLVDQGYLRDSFNFVFDVEAEDENGEEISQSQDTVIEDLGDGLSGEELVDVVTEEEIGEAHARYDMGLPSILPSAVYLHEMEGEAQHHSSRIIQELFNNIRREDEGRGLIARELDDFDPYDHPADLVVEVWRIINPRVKEGVDWS